MDRSDGMLRCTQTLAWAGHQLNEEQEGLLDRYADWLVEEAMPAGGLGPREQERLWPRHIADSLAFSVGWDVAPEEVLDVGTGVGLPGVPLSILWPDCYVTLLDRAGRRIRMLRRVVRILALPRARVAQGDIFSVADEWEGIVFRGSVKAQEAVGLSSKLLAENGRAVLGLSRRSEPPMETRDLMAIAGAMGLEAELISVPTEILDGPAWLLIMSRNG